MRPKEIYDSTSNRSVLNKIYKRLVSKQERICDRCPYHGKENAYRNRKDKKNWKKYRTKQWKSK